MQSTSEQDYWVVQLHDLEPMNQLALHRLYYTRGGKLWESCYQSNCKLYYSAARLPAVTTVS